MDSIGKIFKVEQGMRRCCVCEELMSRETAAFHFNEPCQLKPELAQAAVAGQSH